MALPNAGYARRVTTRSASPRRLATRQGATLPQTWQAAWQPKKSNHRWTLINTDTEFFPPEADPFWRKF